MTQGGSWTYVEVDRWRLRGVEGAWARFIFRAHFDYIGKVGLLLLVANDQSVEVPAGLSRLEIVCKSLLLYTEVLTVLQDDEVLDDLLLLQALYSRKSRHFDVAMASPDRTILSG